MAYEAEDMHQAKNKHQVRGIHRAKGAQLYDQNTPLTFWKLLSHPPTFDILFDQGSDSEDQAEESEDEDEYSPNINTISKVAIQGEQIRKSASIEAIQGGDQLRKSASNEEIYLHSTIDSKGPSQNRHGHDTGASQNEENKGNSQNEGLKTLGKDMIALATLINDESSYIHLYDVHCCPEIDINLLSLGTLEVKGLRWSAKIGLLEVQNVDRDVGLQSTRHGDVYPLNQPEKHEYKTGQGLIANKKANSKGNRTCAIRPCELRKSYAPAKNGEKHCASGFWSRSRFLRIMRIEQGPQETQQNRVYRPCGIVRRRGSIVIFLETEIRYLELMEQRSWKRPGTTSVGDEDSINMERQLESAGGGIQWEFQLI